MLTNAWKFSWVDRATPIDGPLFTDLHRIARGTQLFPMSQHCALFNILFHCRVLSACNADADKRVLSVERGRDGRLLQGRPRPGHREEDVQSGNAKERAERASGSDWRPTVSCGDSWRRRCRRGRRRACCSDVASLPWVAPLPSMAQRALQTQIDLYACCNAAALRLQSGGLQ